MSSFALEDKEFYYLLHIRRDYINVNTFNKINFSIVENNFKKENKLKRFIEDYLCKDNVKKSTVLIKKLSFFDIPELAKEKLGERFFRHFIKDNDRYLFFKDKYSKHFLIDWNKLENKEFPFVQPKLFPFYINHLNVLIDDNYDIYHKNRKILPPDVFKLEKEYKKSLVPKLKEKSKIYDALIADLEKRYYKTKNFIKSMNLRDYNLEGNIEFFDIAGNTIFEEKILFESFDLPPCSLKIYGLDMEVNYIL
jgi:hypothetical protein